mmetsp:Transcript_36395/g.90758  ORF Transcript_36395/g.90758 Transcript_36395/m.90758 type:complete len:200 (-) Transcript_36395:2398-2997(-)
MLRCSPRQSKVLEWMTTCTTSLPPHALQSPRRVRSGTAMMSMALGRPNRRKGKKPERPKSSLTRWERLSTSKCPPRSGGMARNPAKRTSLQRKKTNPRRRMTTIQQRGPGSLAQQPRKHWKLRWMPRHAWSPFASELPSRVKGSWKIRRAGGPTSETLPSSWKTTRPRWLALLPSLWCSCFVTCALGTESARQLRKSLP